MSWRQSDLAHDQYGRAVATGEEGIETGARRKLRRTCQKRSEEEHRHKRPECHQNLPPAHRGWIARSVATASTAKGVPQVQRLSATAA